jgi:hypothetical protein
MRLYHPDAVTDDLMRRLDPPTGDAEGLTVEFDLPVRIKGDVAAGGAEMSLTGEMTCPLDDSETGAVQVGLFGFDQTAVLYRPQMGELSQLRGRGSLRMPDLSFPEFRAEGLEAVASMRATFLGVDAATNDSVAVAVLASPYLSGIPDLAGQIPPGLVGQDGWFERPDDFDLEDERFAPDRFAPDPEDKGRRDENENDSPTTPGNDRPDNIAQAEAVRQAALRAQRTGQVGDFFENDTPELHDRPTPMIPLRPSRAPIITPDAIPDQIPAPTK